MKSWWSRFYKLAETYRVKILLKRGSHPFFWRDLGPIQNIPFTSCMSMFLLRCPNGFSRFRTVGG